MHGETWAILGGADTENLDVCLVSSPQNKNQNNFRTHKMQTTNTENSNNGREGEEVEVQQKQPLTSHFFTLSPIPLLLSSS